MKGQRLTKASLVAAGLGVTTMASTMADALPQGIRLIPVADGPTEIRRIGVAHRGDVSTVVVRAVVEALRASVR